MKFPLALASFAFAAAAHAHVALQTPTASPASAYQAVFVVGHGCDKSPTRQLTVQLPSGLAGAKPVARPGWTLDAQATRITWTANTSADVLADSEHGEFRVAVQTPAQAARLEWAVQQECAQGRRDWVAALDVGTPTPSAAPANVKVENAWARPAGPGQGSSAVYMTLTAQEPLTLLGAQTPAANIVELHEMKMEGDVMKMRAAETLPLAAGKPLQLKPGGFHFMLMDLPGPMKAGTTIQVTLRLRDARGQERRQAVTVPVRGGAPQ